MRPTHFKATMKAITLAVSILLLAAAPAFAQQQINLSAGPATANMPDGSVVPMWGYTCGAVVTGSTATCAALNPQAAGGWSPVVITVPTGASGGLAINLTNNLSFANGNSVPTSIMIVGQVGGGLGNSANTIPSPVHAAQGVTWPTVTPPGSGPTFNPPPQGKRVQSFGTEVAAGATTLLPAWSVLKPGTYLLESGTHPSIQGPMGLYGILVVTAAPTANNLGVETAPGIAYPGVSYDAEIPMLLSEIDPAQNNAVNAAVNTAGFSETQVWNRQNSGGPVTGILLTNPGSNYTLAPTVTINGAGSNATAVATIAGGAVTGITITDAGDGYSSASGSTTITIAPATGDVTGGGAAATATVTMGGCGGGPHTCYPPAVNYTPLYYAINGVPFNKTNAGGSLFPITPALIAPATGTGSVLVRVVNAGSRMHVPAIVGSQVAGQTGGTRPIVTGFQVIAEDGNPLPGVPKVKSEVFMAAGKTFDIMINGQATSGTTIAPYTSALAIYDRELSLSGNSINRDAGMLAYISINGSGLPVAAGTGIFAAAVARADSYNALVTGQTLTVSDPAKGVIANDTNVYGVQLLTAPANGTLTLNANGTFTYVPSGTGTSDSFSYCANGTVTGTTCSSGITATVTLGTSSIVDSGITCPGGSFTANTATYLAVKTPGILAGCTDGAKLPLTVVPASVTPVSGLTTVHADVNGGFTATGSGSASFTFKVQNSQGTQAGPFTANVSFPAGGGLTVTVLDGKDKTTAIADYRWIIEEDRTFYIDPHCVQNPPPTGCPTAGGIVPTLGVNFHTSYMPFVAQGCTGPQSCESGQTVLGQPAVCDVSNGVCRTDGTQLTAVDPSQVQLDPTKRYYISVLPGDAANPFYQSGSTGHGMGGASISAGQTSVTVYSQPSPYQPGKLSVMVYEDDFPLNGEQDGGGGVDILAPYEPGLGSFQIHLWDAMGGNGDFTGQMTYDMFNQPLTNSLAGTIDPSNGLDACPISSQSRIGTIPDPNNPGQTIPDPNQTGITGMIVTCPKYESDGKTLSPLAGQAVVANLMPGRFGVIATPGADRIARGEEWLQTNTLDGQKAHDSFVRIGEPTYFQEFGPASYHVSIGFANPAIINGRLKPLCNGQDQNLTVAQNSCNNTLTGMVTGEHLSRTPDERLYSTGSRDTYYWTQCYVSVGDPDGEDFAFTKCKSDGTFSFSGLPAGDWRVTTFDQWNDQLVDGLSSPVSLSGGKTVNMEIPATQWQTNLYTRTFIDDNKDGVSQKDEGGIPFANVAVRLRDGSLENLLVTDFTGTANFNETFPLFSWYTVETDVTRYKNTGTHVVYDNGGPVDGSASCGQTGYPPCGTSTIGAHLANTVEQVSVPANLRVPGSVYCAASPTVGADCTGKSILNGPVSSDPPTQGSSYLSTGRIDNPWTGGVEGWQGFPGQNNFIEFGKEPYVAGENGGIKGHVVYASTRPFDDPQLLVQTQWEPLIPHVKINLYQEGFAADGVTPTLTLVDTTQTSSFDDYAQGFHKDANGNTIPNMSCPGQGGSSGTLADLFFFSLYNQPEYLDLYNNVLHGNGATTPLPYNSQFKCYDGMHNWNQVQPAPYDGMYQFPSITSLDPTTGKPAGTNCTICSPNTAVPTSDLYHGLPMLPTGKYVVEVVVPPGFELVKEEDKNILIGDNYIAPVTQEFGALGNVFIVPDQASIGAANNGNNAQNSTQSLGTSPANSIVPGFIPEPVWPCVGTQRIVPDYISLYPQSKQVAPFAGATRNLCDRKEVTLSDQAGAIAKFYIFTSTHMASKFTGGITDDYTSEFDPFSPQFGEKFSPPDLPVSVKDWAGNEISRVYADHWGAYNGMTYSTWEVNPPNPTGYAPTMMVLCMNDPGPIPNPNGIGMITDPLFSQGYSQFCYELPFMPGTTQYLDTPVVPTSAFAGAGYNNVDCAYPDATPAISEVDGDGVGPWVSAPGKTLTIKALGDQLVPNYAYSGPSASTAPFNQKSITRHYGFGATQGTVTIGGQPATVTGWVDNQITVKVPNHVPQCAVQQQAQYAPGATTAYCGELVITAANGKQSIDTVTVTVGGKAPSYVTGNAPLTQTSVGAIQTAIDAANPGDLIIVPPGAYNEMVIMWKPVRLQGVGAASSIINANTQPAGKLDPWRARVNCMFGLALNGQPDTYTKGSSNPFDPSGNFTCGGWPGFVGATNNPQVDRLPLEGILGWDTSVNGNLAQLLQEPTLMGAYEGAGISVLGKGVNIPPGSTNIFGNGNESAFPTGTTLLGAADCTTGTSGSNPYPSNFQCNPSSIDGLGITDSSQGGGGIFVHAWGHNLQIANNQVYNNTGTLTGGITVGQGESPDAYLAGSVADSDPGSCNTGAGLPANTQLPYCFDLNVNVHNNAVRLNSSIGDELYSSTPAGGGGVTICTGADYYKFNYNWVCGNLSSGDGGGLVHLGYIWNGDIEHNSFLFNQSTNPTVPTNGGGLIVMGAPPDGLTAAGLECGNTVADADCTPGLSDGTGPGLVINANLIMGNGAESGSGGGIAFQHVNGTEVVNFPTKPKNWNDVTVTNNIIANNVAGWDGGGISLLDALNVNIVNNTISSNVSTASAGVLFTTLGAPLASTQGSNCTLNGATTSCPQPAGLVSVPNSAVLLSVLPGNTKCPSGHGDSGQCLTASYPLLANNVFWQNSSYFIGVGALSAAFQQNVVSLYNSFTTNMAPSQPQADATTANGSGSIITGGTGACANASYWDIGVRGDTGPSNHALGITLNPRQSLLTDASDYSGNGNFGSNPSFVSQYCNGSRQPPEACGTSGGCGWSVPAGISDATVPNPIFNLTPVATVDEGNNWINLRWGPLSLVNPVTNTVLGNYALSPSSPAIDNIPVSAGTYSLAPSTDFFGNPRPDVKGTAIDVGAVEFQNPATPRAQLIPSPLTFANQMVGTQSTAQTVTLTNIGGVTLHVSGSSITGQFNVGGGGSCSTGAFNLPAGASCTYKVRFAPTALGAATGSLVVTSNDPVSPTATVVLNGTGAGLSSIAPTTGVRGTTEPVTLTGLGLTGATAVTVSGNGVTVNSFAVTSDTTITASFTISATAALTARTVAVVTPNGTTNNVTFTVVNPSVPTLTSIAPTTGVRGTSVNVTLTGTGLLTTNTTTGVAVSGTGVSVSTIVVVNDTTVTATFAITAGATVSARNVTVTTAGGSATLNGSFTVQGPTLTSIAPISGARGTTVPVTLTGNNLAGATAVTVSSTGVTCTGVTSTATTVNANCVIAATATLGARTVTVTTPIGTTGSVAFTVVNPPVATLTSVSPNNGVRGTAVSVTLTGTNFTTGSTVAVSGAGINVSGVTVVSSTQITANFAISSGGGNTGAHSVTVTNASGTASNSVTFSKN